MAQYLRGPEFTTQHHQVTYSRPVTLGLEELTPSSGLCQDLHITGVLRHIAHQAGLEEMKLNLGGGEGLGRFLVGVRAEETAFSGNGFQ